jgi:hypothetical protein
MTSERGMWIGGRPQNSCSDLSLTALKMDFLFLKYNYREHLVSHAYFKRIAIFDI